MEAQSFKKASFELDSLEGQVFEGYTTGATWNGFECPYFTKDVAESILTACVEAGTLHSWLLNEHVPCFFAAWEETQSDVEEFDGIETEHGTLYPIGAWSWVWWQAEEPESAPKPDYWRNFVRLLRAWYTDDLLRLSSAFDRTGGGWVHFSSHNIAKSLVEEMARQGLVKIDEQGGACAPGPQWFNKEWVIRREGWPG